ncbi:MAG: hypothetical protein R3B96_14185 [Pirellulaceae bacterium]
MACLRFCTGIATAAPQTRQFQPEPWRGAPIEQVSRSRESVLHVWSANHPESEPSYTLQPHGSWALASPVEGDAEGMWVLYVCGEPSTGCRGGRVAGSQA